MDTEIEIIPGRCVVCDGPVETDGGLLFCEFCPAVDDEDGSTSSSRYSP